MQNLSVRQGFSSFFFQVLPNSLVADAVDDFEFHELVRQEVQSPPLPAVGRNAARQLYQPCFALTIELWLPRRPLLRIQCCGNPIERTALADTFHRADTHIQVLGDLFVLQTLVRFEQNPCVQHLPRGVAASRRKADKLLTFFFREIYVIEFHLYYLHDSSPRGTVFGFWSTLITQWRRLDV
jgi:hypothetical protein